MAAKIVLAFCAQALLIQFAFSQCIGGYPSPYGLNSPIGYNGLAGPGLGGPYGGGCGCGGLASSGGGFPVTSVSPLVPTGLSIISENAIEGSLTVGGSLPFLGTVALEGMLPTSGSGAVSYGCGNQDVGILSEGPITTGIVGPGYPAGPGAYGAGPGYGPGLIGAPAYNGIAGCGCGPVY